MISIEYGGLSMDAIEFGRFIARLRKEKGMTQAELGEKLNVTDKAVSRWERGVGYPDIGTLESLANALGVGVAELIQCQRLSSDNENKKEMNCAVESTLDFMKYYEKMEHKKKICSMIIGGIGIFLLCIGIGVELYLNQILGSIYSSVGIIGGADGPTSIFVAGRINTSIHWVLIGIGVILIIVCIVSLMRKKKN